EATGNFEKYDIGAAAKSIAALAEDLSRWYIRRSRRRFQHSESKKDFENASAVFGFLLFEISKLIAPLTPFFSEALYKSLVVSHKSSVHFENWPKADKKMIDNELLDLMKEIRRLASLALAKRAEAGIKVRQPLQKLKVKSQKFKVSKELLKILSDEINVKKIIFDSEIKDEIELDVNITPELKAEGIVRETIRMIQDLRQDAGLKQKDRIILMVQAPDILEKILMNVDLSLKQGVGARTVEFKKTGKFSAEINSRIDDWPVWFGIRKV
ncbi:MAG: class I tRNA ligase family protein, partial [Candidatus Brennerbacteria bacterium]|nr:class I tRNA ligase family protein [Candidatus Brennerbacteria bacterium]